ncbi:acyltransferase domain-containing protein [Streptomyces sp. b94]|uniref:acyltransferase domain-containing protein n=1 Tax=Streptomyces sp. b94 TaxID=1827634 RepID=UPI001B35B41F|nr:acyltransferase domain-containing protein [Streptomyces sp. b94]MBQ1101169.1 acyltransferase domain-containing protein [Streptomyces sp. b94]
MIESAQESATGFAGASVHVFPPQGTFVPAAVTAATGRSERFADALARITEQTDEVSAAEGRVRLSRFLTEAEPPSVEELQQTGCLELASFVTSLAAHRTLCDAHGRPAVVLGVSAGDFAAMTAAGVFSLRDGAHLALRAAEVQRGCPGRMVALKCSCEEADKIILRSGDRDARVALVFDDRSVVVTVPGGEVRALREAASATGVQTVVTPVPFGSHHPSLSPQMGALRGVVASYERHPATMPVHSAAGGRVYRDDDTVPMAMAENLVSPVDFPASLRQSLFPGARVVFDLDTGGALASSARRILAQSTVAVHAPFSESAFAW